MNGNRLLELIEAIYESEISCRLEWRYDGGFTWSIQGTGYPRIWKDDALEGSIKVIAESAESVLLKNNPLLEKDWIHRGNAEIFSEAIMELSRAIFKLYPNSKFTEYWKNSL